MGYMVKTGIDGKLYAVFKNAYERELFERECDLFSGFPVACFGQYENAFCLELPSSR